MPAGLVGPDMPEEFAHVWLWFVELDEARTVSGFGASSISYVDIKAWAELTGRDPTPFEVRLLRRLDRRRLSA